MNDKLNKKVIINLEELLKNDAPYLVEDGKVNLKKLQGLLEGKTTEKEDDRFYFNWAGKDKVFQAIQAPAYSTLVPDKNKSIGWEKTKNLMIVGENLETLKLLLKPYFGKVKVIYIDPPYNTGKDFIYKDNFTSPLKDYLERTGQKDENGSRLTTNAETSGRYHSDWLNFMYPRLFMARNLLKNDGVIFISIDDNEVHHLRMIMDEIFGEQQHLGTFVWRRRIGSSLSQTWVSSDHEYVLAYTKSEEEIYVRGEDRDMAKYNIPDGKGRFYASMPLTVGMNRSMRPNQWYGLKHPVTGTEYWPPQNRVWAYYPPTMEEKIKADKIIWPEDFPDKSLTSPRLKSYPEDAKRDKKPLSTWINEKGVKQLPNEDKFSLVSAKNEEGTRILNQLVGESEFVYPKPPSLITGLIEQFSKEEDIILDFFAGSGTTAQAVFDINKKDDGQRKFILVQLAETIDEKSEAYKKGYKNIADICIERLRKVSENNHNDLQYKVFELRPSNFNLKQEFELEENKELTELKSDYLKELGLYVDQPILSSAQPINIVYEIILKNGFSLNSKIQNLALGSNKFSRVMDDENKLEIHICLDSKVEDVSVEEIRTPKYKDMTFAFYDNALTDSQKINLNTFVKLQVI